jgi:hypothetical protein
MEAPEKVDPWSIINYLHTSTELPPQRKDKFSDLPVTLYIGPRFYVDIYFWLDGTTSVHQHGFAGAFQVFLGSSIHSRYSFENEQKINAHLSTGQLLMKDIQLLQKGDIRKILPGKELIHALFHLDRPSATITVRTNQSPDALPQYDYLNPHLAIDPFFNEPTSVKQIQSVSLLLRMRHPKIDSIVSELISLSDFHTTFSILNIVFKFLTDKTQERVFKISNGRERFEDLIKIARKKHGALADTLLPVFEEMKRKDTIVDQRKYLTSSEHRFLLALLLNVQDRRVVLDLVTHRFPQRNAIDTLCEWAKELATLKIPGSNEPNILGVDGFDDNYLFIFRCLLQGLSVEEIKKVVSQEYAAAQAESFNNNFQDRYNAILSSYLLKSVLAES